MGFLSNLLTPHKHLNLYKGAAKAIASGHIKEGLDAAGMLAGKYDDKSYMQKSLGQNLMGGGSSPKTDPLAGVNVPDPSQYAGDPSDPAYGSFTQPFGAQQFLDYQDPGYAFELSQGTQALQNAASAGSGAFSGAALKDLLGYSQNFARTGYNDAFNRYQTQQGNIFNRLSGLAQLGQNAAAGTGAAGVNLAGNAGQAIQNAGSAAGAGIVGAGNALNSGLNNYWLFGTPQGRQLWGGGG